jgi:nitrogen regulatory protein P-II 1
MKRIEAFLQPHRVSKVVAALHGLPRFPGFTVLDAHGQGHGRGHGGHYVYTEIDGVRYRQHSMLIVLCEDSEATRIAELIASAAHTGNAGDGLVIVSNVCQVRFVREARSEGEAS